VAVARTGGGGVGVAASLGELLGRGRIF